MHRSLHGPPSAWKRQHLSTQTTTVDLAQGGWRCFFFCSSANPPELSQHETKKFPWAQHLSSKQRGIQTISGLVTLAKIMDFPRAVLWKFELGLFLRWQTHPNGASGLFEIAT